MCNKEKIKLTQTRRKFYKKGGGKSGTGRKKSYIVGVGKKNVRDGYTRVGRGKNIKGGCLGEALGAKKSSRGGE